MAFFSHYFEQKVCVRRLKSSFYSLLRLAIFLESTKIPTRPNPGNLLHSDLWQNMRSLNGNNRKRAQAGAIKLLYEVFSLNWAMSHHWRIVLPARLKWFNIKRAKNAECTKAAIYWEKWKKRHPRPKSRPSKRNNTHRRWATEKPARSATILFF